MVSNQVINKKINNMYNNKKRVSTTTNGTTNYIQYYKLLTNRYYKGIIYILLTKGFTYGSEVEKIYPINSRQYLLNLQQKGVIRKKLVSDDIKDFVLHTSKNLNDNQLNNLVIYSLTPKGKQFFSREDIYEVIIEELNEELTYYEELLQKYDNRKEELAYREQQKEREHQAKLRSMGLVIGDEKQNGY